MSKEFIAMVLRQAVGMLHMVEVSDLEDYVNGVASNNATYDAIGPIVDPTEYRDTLRSGRRDQVRTQLAIAQKLLEIRQLTETLKPDPDTGQPITHP